MNTNSKQALMGAWTYGIVAAMAYGFMMHRISGCDDPKTERTQAEITNNTPEYTTTSGVWRAEETLQERGERYMRNQKGLTLMVR